MVNDRRPVSEAGREIRRIRLARRAIKEEDDLLKERARFKRETRGGFKRGAITAAVSVGRAFGIGRKVPSLKRRTKKRR